MKILAIIIVFISQPRCLFDIIWYRFLFKLAGKSNNKYQFTKGSKTTLQERELQSVKCQALLNLKTCLTQRTGHKEIKTYVSFEKKNTVSLCKICHSMEEELCL